MDRTRFSNLNQSRREWPRGPEAGPAPGSVVTTGNARWQQAGTAEHRVIRVDLVGVGGGLLRRKPSISNGLLALLSPAHDANLGIAGGLFSLGRHCCGGGWRDCVLFFFESYGQMAQHR